MTRRRNRKTVAAPPTPAPASDAPASPTVETVAAMISAAVAASVPMTDSNPVPETDAHAAALAAATPPAPSPVTPVVDAPAIPRHRRTIGTIAAGDVPAAPVRTMSLAARFASLAVNAASVMFRGAFLNVSPPSVRFSSPLAAPDALGYVGAPIPPDARGDALRHALALARAAANPNAADPALVRGVTILYAHDRAMRSTRTRDAGYFDANGVSALDVRASLARAACYLARIDPDGLGTNAACDATIPGIVSHLAARVASLDATPTPPPAAPSAPVVATSPVIHKLS